MQLTPVKSSNINAVGYDAEKRTLFVQFTNGTLYAYDDVPIGTHLGLKVAESVGKYFSANVRGKFTARKLDAMP